MNSKYIASPKYSFGKEKRFFKMYQFETPGPNKYDPYTVTSDWDFIYKKLHFGTSKRSLFNFKNYIPGPGKYDIKRNEDLISAKEKNYIGKSGPKFGKEKRFLDEDNIDDNLFLPTDY